jgi:uncharacterized protein (DUF1499 family)
MSLVSCLLLLFLLSCGKGSEIMSDLPANPLPGCESSGNCARMSVRLDVSAHEAAQNMADVIRDMNGTLNRAEAMSGDAVFRIPVFGWRDDVQFLTEPMADGGCVLHLRSKSRVGRYDLGVNRHRLKRIVRLLGYELKESNATP